MEFKTKEYDFFISHASEDKDSFVRPLVNELSNLGFKVWYDEFSLKLGDSLFDEISEGIKKSHFGIVVLSKHFLKKEWTKKELKGLINKEIFTSSNIILPIWLEISAKEIYTFSPILADKVSISVNSNEIDKVLKKLLSLSKYKKVTEEIINKKVKYLQSCNIDERKKYIIDTEARIKNLVYFQQAYYNWFCSDEAFGDIEWDDFVADKKRHELQNSYNLPYNVMYNPEFNPGIQMNYIIKLSKKWINQKATLYEICELIFLLDEYHDLDLPFILFGFPQDSLDNEKAFNLCFVAPYMISPKKIYPYSEIEKETSKVFLEYYSPDLYE